MQKRILELRRIHARNKTQHKIHHGIFNVKLCFRYHGILTSVMTLFFFKCEGIAGRKETPHTWHE